MPLAAFKSKYLPSDDFLTTIDDMTLVLKEFTSGTMDAAIFDALELSEAERKEVYWATAELVQQRLGKAASR